MVSLSFPSEHLRTRLPERSCKRNCAPSSLSGRPQISPLPWKQDSPVSPLPPTRFITIWYYCLPMASSIWASNGRVKNQRFCRISSRLSCHSIGSVTLPSIRLPLLPRQIRRCYRRWPRQLVGNSVLLTTLPCSIKPLVNCSF